MNNSDSYDSKLSQARGLASQLGMFAEENDIPKDLWDSLEATIYDFYQVSQYKWKFFKISITKIKKFWINKSKCDHKLINYLLNIN